MKFLQTFFSRPMLLAWDIYTSAENLSSLVVFYILTVIICLLEEKREYIIFKVAYQHIKYLKYVSVNKFYCVLHLTL